jgi:hypothetical protein
VSWFELADVSAEDAQLAEAELRLRDEEAAEASRSR